LGDERLNVGIEGISFNNRSIEIKKAQLLAVIGTLRKNGLVHSSDSPDFVPWPSSKRVGDSITA
jgi:hypothetical protein